MADSEIEVEIGAGALVGEYAVRVVRAVSGGEPHGTLRLDVHDVLRRRGQLEASVLASSARTRGGVMPTAELPLRQTGQELFEALFAGSVGGVYRASLAVARERSSRLRVVLRLVASELSVLPWEAMWDPELEVYVCRREPLVRHVPAPFTPEPHLWQKLKMLANGTLLRPIDIFDLIMHASLPLLLAVKLIRMTPPGKKPPRSA